MVFSETPNDIASELDNLLSRLQKLVVNCKFENELSGFYFLFIF